MYRNRSRVFVGIGFRCQGGRCDDPGYGWVTLINGAPTLFIAVEQLPEPGFDVVLALHEMIHMVHQRRAAYDWPADRVDADLFREGLAVHATTRLMPAIDASGHLWFAPGQEEWIERCRNSRAVLLRQALADLDRTDRSDRWFSGAASREGDLPGRCGYWLGWHLVDRLIVHDPLDAVLNWPLKDVTHRLRRLLTRLSQRSE